MIKCQGSNTARQVSPAAHDRGDVTCQMCGRRFTGQRKLTRATQVMVPRHKEEKQ